MIKQSISEMASDEVRITLCGAGIRCLFGTQVLMKAPSWGWVATCRASLTAQVASSSTLILSQSAVKGTSHFKETNSTTTLQNSTASRECSCQTSLISFPLSPPDMVPLHPSWETMAAAFNAITAVFSHSPHLVPLFTASVSVPRLPAQPTAVVSNGVPKGDRIDTWTIHLFVYSEAGS